ncbi:MULTISPECIES: ABC-F family ATP-binding cassette domain-containing protein [Hyphomonas]|nr:MULTISPECIES: ABC-F family ATP-binding cassette domain-containing protein [Hyphomonas]MBB40238.1 ABC transporter [Hyphomonas sp.]|tara:strand:+ start:103 stop:1716 length:1614 start_codon:yes stop_codon:yes gene_type:complete
MTCFLTLDALSLSTPDGTPLFRDLTLSLGRERVGLVGRNGSGKSTLLRAIMGDVPPSGGHIHSGGTVGMLQQALDETQDLAGALGVTGALACLARLEAGQGNVEDAAAADWTLPSRIEQALADTGLRQIPLDTPVAILSGGERMRAALARQNIEAPDLLLLDEPTNNLDTEGREAISTLLRTWPGGLLIASHDRDLLEQVDRIVELSPVGTTLFSGGWHEYAAAREAAREAAEADLARASDALKRTRKSAQQAKEKQDRRDKAGRTTRAKGDAPKMLLDKRQERAEATRGKGSALAARQMSESEAHVAEARERIEILAPLTMDLPLCGLPSGRRLIEFCGVEMKFGDRHLFGPLDFALTGPERVAIAGPNGSGKSTLLRLVTGALQPSSGAASCFTENFALLDQHVSLLATDETILENMHRLNPGLSANAAHAALARFGFRNDDALQVAGTLSGGEKLRAGLACVFARETSPDLLILDEPTNHLDLRAIEALETGLNAWDGAILLVCHDTAFVDAIGVTRSLELTPEERRREPDANR